MERKCPRCGFIIKDENMKRCPRCFEILEKPSSCIDCRGCSVKHCMADRKKDQ